MKNGAKGLIVPEKLRDKRGMRGKGLPCRPRCE
jgi:hypothetical protein